jgi:hypothetical protein
LKRGLFFYSFTVELYWNATKASLFHAVTYTPYVFYVQSEIGWHCVATVGRRLNSVCCVKSEIFFFFSVLLEVISFALFITDRQQLTVTSDNLEAVTDRMSQTVNISVFFEPVISDSFYLTLGLSASIIRN